MTGYEALSVALITYVVTKSFDLVLSIFTEKWEFKKSRRNHIFKEIEELKNTVGVIYELAANWAAYENKQDFYIEKFANDHELIGKFTKYPEVANAARDVVHYCKISAHAEKTHETDVIESKKQLHEKYKSFLSVCENYINQLV